MNRIMKQINEVSSILFKRHSCIIFPTALQWKCFIRRHIWNYLLDWNVLDCMLNFAKILFWPTQIKSSIGTIFCKLHEICLVYNSVKLVKAQFSIQFSWRLGCKQRQIRRSPSWRWRRHRRTRGRSSFGGHRRTSASALRSTCCLRKKKI